MEGTRSFSQVSKHLNSASGVFQHLPLPLPYTFPCFPLFPGSTVLPLAIGFLVNAASLCPQCLCACDFCLYPSRLPNPSQVLPQKPFTDYRLHSDPFLHGILMLSCLCLHLFKFFLALCSLFCLDSLTSPTVSWREGVGSEVEQLLALEPNFWATRGPVSFVKWRNKHPPLAKLRVSLTIKWGPACEIPGLLALLQLSSCSPEGRIISYPGSQNHRMPSTVKQDMIGSNC